MGRLPNAGDLAASGVRESNNGSHGENGSHGDNGCEEGNEPANITRGAGGQEMASTATGAMLPTQPMVCVGPGLAPLPRKLVERIKANEFIDFTELPPAKGKGRPIPQPAEGQFIVLQAADLVQSRKTIPDYATWSQCFALYVAALAAEHWVT